MSAEIIKIASRRRLGEAPKTSTDMAMPLQQREPTIGELLAAKRKAEGPRPKGPRRLGSPAMRACRTALMNDAGTVESCMRWLLEIASRDHDPRAIEAFMDEFKDWAVFEEAKDIDRVMAFLTVVLHEYRKRFPPPKPTLVP